MFANNFQFPNTNTYPNMWMNNNVWNPTTSAGWNNNFNPYYGSNNYGNNGFGFNSFPSAYSGFGNNNALYKSSGIVPGYGKQVITTPTREGYDIEYEIPGGRAKKYYSSQSFVQQVL